MKISIHTSLTTKNVPDAQVVYVSDLSKLTQQEIQCTNAFMTSSHIDQKEDGIHVMNGLGVVPSRIYVLIVSTEVHQTTDVLLETVASVTQLLNQHHVSAAAWHLPDDLVKKVGIHHIVDVFTVGILESGYEFTKYKKSPKAHRIRLSDCRLIHPLCDDSVQSSCDKSMIMAQATVRARDLVNEPPSETTPQHLAEFAQSLAKASRKITCSVLSQTDMKKLGMNALLSIAKGSEEPPVFIHLTYDGGGKKQATIVGKGITFDSGGLSIKPGGSMETMKMDMAGAAVILGVFSVLDVLQLPIRVTGLIASCENMPSGKAVKPGDVVKAMNGTTIEIVNTDAEGRVVLADALSYAQKFVKSDAIIDMATLTGACMVALGEDVAGMFSNDKTLAQALLTASRETGERIWELPLIREFDDMIKSNVADIKNITKSRYGGAISGAAFIRRFIPSKTPWAHIDIAGPAFSETNKPLTPYGGTGFGVRLLLSYLSSLVS